MDADMAQCPSMGGVKEVSACQQSVRKTRVLQKM